MDDAQPQDLLSLHKRDAADDDHIKAYQQALKGLLAHTREVERLLVQTLGVLGKLGNPPPFDATQVLNRGEVRRQDFQASSQRLLKQTQDLENLVRTSALITTSLEIDQVLNEVMDTVISLTGAERAYLLMLVGEDGDLSVRAARNAAGDALSGDEVVFSRGVIAHVLETKQPIITTNAQDDERFKASDSIIRNDLRSLMVIPMLLQNVPLGVLYVDNRLATAVFHKKSIPILTAFANQAAIAIENARLFERVQESLSRTRREVKRLRVQLDQNKLKTQVTEITNTDYFQEIANLAKTLRAERFADTDTDPASAE